MFPCLLKAIFLLGFTTWSLSMGTTEYSRACVTHPCLVGLTELFQHCNKSFPFKNENKT